MPGLVKQFSRLDATYTLDVQKATVSLAVKIKEVAARRPALPVDERRVHCALTRLRHRFKNVHQG
jgi:hypothetical protein